MGGNLSGGGHRPKTGDVSVHSYTSVKSSNQSTTSPKRLGAFTVNLSGNYRIVFELSSSIESASINGQIYINDVPSGIVRTSNTTNYVIYTEDFILKRGDVVGFYGWNPSGNTATARIRNRSLNTSEAIFITTQD
jgi:hypothetical protein